MVLLVVEQLVISPSTLPCRRRRRKKNSQRLLMMPSLRPPYYRLTGRFIREKKSQSWNHFWLTARLYIGFFNSQQQSFIEEEKRFIFCVCDVWLTGRRCISTSSNKISIKKWEGGCAGCGRESNAKLSRRHKTHTARPHYIYHERSKKKRRGENKIPNGVIVRAAPKSK